MFLDSILRENRSVLDLLTADYTFLNEPLAKHYGIPHITGSHFRRVTLPKGSPRRGLLGHGSILSITSYSTRTSAVLRGKYVLENLLASPPPPPPPDVPSLNTERSGQPLSMKEAMQLHRASPACASCHAKMDPIGFALENFDALGRWRAEENGRPIDVSSALPDGTTVDGVEGVRRLVLRDPALFVEAHDRQTADVRADAQYPALRPADDPRHRPGIGAPELHVRLAGAGRGEQRPVPEQNGAPGRRPNSDRETA